MKRNKYLYTCDYPTGSMVDKNLKSLCARVGEKFSHLRERGNIDGIHYYDRLGFILDVGYLRRNVFNHPYRSAYTTFPFPVNDVKHINLWDVEFRISRMPL